MLQTLVRLGETQRVEQALAEMDGPERDSGEMRNAVAVAAARPGRSGGGDGRAGPRPRRLRSAANAHLWVVQAFLLDAIARDALGDAGAARRALERALDLAEPEGLLFPFLARSRAGTARAPPPARHRARRPDRRDPERAGRPEARPAAEPVNARGGLREPLSHAETRVLRYLPTKLSAPEIADQLYLSVNTVKTHMRHLYDKLGVHRRHEAVEQARALGLLAPPRAGLTRRESPGRVTPAHPARVRLGARQDLPRKA